MDALLYEEKQNGKVRCLLCRHNCLIENGRRGICGVRENRSGKLETLVYGNLIAQHLDPIEKKPFFHVMPATLTHSIATVGCNFRCRFCQNADIAHMPINHDGLIMGNQITCEEVVSNALKSGAKSISYTYTEPTVFFEVAMKTATLASENGLKNLFVTNGYMSEQALHMIAPFLDAANVDLKAYREKTYQKYMGASLGGVKDTLVQMKRLSIFIEVTTLIIPEINDSEKELTDLARFIVNELGPFTPWHVSRFHPTYRLIDRKKTPVSTLLKARDIGEKAGLYHVYTGNIPGHGGEDTLCHQCRAPLIRRLGFTVMENRVKNGSCPDCHAPVHGLSVDTEGSKIS